MEKLLISGVASDKNTALKILPFALVIGIGLFNLQGDILLSSAPLEGYATSGIAALIAGIAATTWSYDGTVLTAVWNGVPALYRGVPSSVAIWKAELYRNIPFVRMV